jgi:hypothetical protein
MRLEAAPVGGVGGQGGVHTRIDHQLGLRLGEDVAGFVLREAGSPTFGFPGSNP